MTPAQISNKIRNDTEKARVAAIEQWAATEALPCAALEQIVRDAKADGVSQVGDVAQAVVRAYRAEGLSVAVHASNHIPAHTRMPAASGKFPDLDAVKSAAERQWKLDAALRAEFQGNQQAYLAYERAAALGHCRKL